MRKNLYNMPKNDNLSDVTVYLGTIQFVFLLEDTYSFSDIRLRGKIIKENLPCSIFI